MINAEKLNHISCEDVFKIYKIADLEVVALRGLDLDVESGEIVAIVGASGSGKSTLLNILAGYDLPSAGKVSVLGRDLLSMTSSAIENVELPMMLIGDTPAKRRKRAKDLLELVGLGDRMNHKQDRLSGGEQQRVAIAISLANNPPLLLADEPTGELDDATAAEVMKVFDSINQELNTTIMIVSHDQDIAYKVDRVVLIRDGKLSTEIMRQKSGEKGDELQEFIIVDGSGRVQVPKTLLDRTKIERRAKVRIDDQGVILEPGEDKK